MKMMMSGVCCHWWMDYQGLPGLSLDGQNSPMELPMCWKITLRCEETKRFMTDKGREFTGLADVK